MQLLSETNLLRLAKESRYRHHWAVDLLIAILVLLISMCLQSILAFSTFLFSLPFRYLSGSSFSGDYLSLISDFKTSELFPLLNLFLTSTLILVPVLYCTLLERRPFDSLGFTRSRILSRYAAGLLIGFVMLSLALGVCILTGSAAIVKNSFHPFLILAFFFGYMIQGMSEEVFCRGFLLQTLSVRNSPWFAVVISSLLFAILHLFNSGITILAFCNLFLFGVFASVCMWKTGSIWEISAIHTAWNFAQGNLYGIRVSGMSPGPSVFQTVLTESRSLWNGGPFGLEGGLAVTAVLLISIMILLVFHSGEASHD